CIASHTYTSSFTSFATPLLCVLFASFLLYLTPTPDIYTLSLHDALPILREHEHLFVVLELVARGSPARRVPGFDVARQITARPRSEEHTSELQSRGHLVCRLLLEKKKIKSKMTRI